MNILQQDKLRVGKILTIGILTLLIAAVCITPWGVTAAISGPDVGVTIDGKSVVFQSGYGKPYIDSNNRTLVPLRCVAETFGAAVSWNNASRIAIVEKNGITVQVPIGRTYILINGVSAPNDTYAVIKDSRTYVPIRAVLEAFGADVSWNNVNRTVVVRTDRTAVDNPAEPASRNGELDAMWISYLEYMEMPKDEAGFKAAVDRMFDRCVDLRMNAVIVQVRSHCDAMYPSAYYPWSAFASGNQGVNPGYDPLEYMISAAHSRKLEFHAWLNPFRVTGYGNKWDRVAASNPAKIWLSDNNPANDRRVLLHQGEYYLNPSVPQVRQMVADGVAEIVSRYNVDGIHFDDYFYPSVNDNDPSLCFDKPEYDVSGSALSIANWRRNNVNMLVKDVYATVKNINPNLEFGISPAGNVDSLQSDTVYFVDIDTWLSNPGYVDYIMPQLYWGFERRDSSGQIAAYAYENNLKTWISLAAKGNAKLYVGLNMANAGMNVSDNNPISEWLRYNDIIARQVLAARKTGKVDGFAFFRYAIFNKSEAQGEVANLIEAMKKP